MTKFIKLKKSNCKNCYKCIRHCPIKSIRFTGNQAHIVSDECILCGQCFVVCPQNAKQIVDDLEKAKVLLSSSEKVIASVAPSFVANYDVSFETFEEALQKIGFTCAEETAIGATIVKTRYEEMIRSHEESVLISSCCPTVNMMIQKHFPQTLPYLAKVVSPMQAHCVDIKERYPTAKTIFIGPCVSKKAEKESCEANVDCVLTFEELTKWFAQEHITLEKEKISSDGIGRARFFPTAGGILKSMTCDSPDYTYLEIDGQENCIRALNDIIDGKITNCFIEMSACSGSCIGGPAMDKEHRNLVSEYITASSYAGQKDFVCPSLPYEQMRKDYPYIGTNKQMPGHHEIEETLKKMGKTKPEDELNCGSCGYNTCREKAVAVCQGKADLTMCLPFLKDKAESFSDNIINNTPNAIIVLNNMLEVQQINSAALKLININSAGYVLGEQVVRILDPVDFIEVRESGRSIHDKRVYLAEYDKFVEETIIYDKSYHIIICIMRDVTDEETEREKKEKISRQTMEITDKIVEKQMRVVHEIASLLGETTAETKIALTHLKESLTDE
ncbi:Electron transport complex subunit RsxB [bioreactor metagenome]|uniref:Electron transport complex subunit RsxB n=1 Tax=bioreactor metagenome TaxID=1076179 RepID=A0A644ZYD0_9ZZZZ